MEELTIYRRTTGTFRRSKDEFRQAIGWLFQNDREEIAEELDKYLQAGLLDGNDQLLYTKFDSKEEREEFRERFEDWKEAFGPVMSAIEISIKNQHDPEELIDQKWLEYKQQSPYHEVA